MPGGSSIVALVSSLDPHVQSVLQAEKTRAENQVCQRQQLFDCGLMSTREKSTPSEMYVAQQVDDRPSKWRLNGCEGAAQTLSWRLCREG